MRVYRWAPHAIRVNTLSPGYMHTDLIIDLLDKQGSEITEQWLEHTPMRRMGRPSELQGAVVWMASEASSFMTGANIVSFQLEPGYSVELTWFVLGCGWGL